MRNLILALLFALAGVVVTPAESKVACACGVRATAE